MTKKIDNFIYYLSLVFLIGSIIMYFVNGKSFGWDTFFGTDALTLYGLIVTFLSLSALKVPFLRKWIKWCLLNFNITKLNHEISVVMDSNLNTEELFNRFLAEINASDLYPNKEYEIYNKDPLLIRFDIPAMNATISIKEHSITSDYQRGLSVSKRHKIELKSVDNYRSMIKNLKFILNILIEKLQSQEKDIQFNKFYIKIKKQTTEYNFLNENRFLLNKSVEVVYSETQLTKMNSTITINAHEGVTISSRNKGEFLTALDFLSDILVN